jgi:hypothetical protein
LKPDTKERREKGKKYFIETLEAILWENDNMKRLLSILITLVFIMATPDEIEVSYCITEPVPVMWQSWVEVIGLNDNFGCNMKKYEKNKKQKEN